MFNYYIFTRCESRYVPKAEVSGVKLIRFKMNKTNTRFINRMFLIAVLLLTVTAVVNAQTAPKIDLKITDSKGNKVWTYNNLTTLYVTVTSSALNTNAAAKDKVQVMAKCEMEPNGEPLTVVETGVNTGIFKGTLKLKEAPMPFANSGFLEVEKGARITVSYLISKDDKGVPETAEDEIYFRGPKWTFTNTGQNHIVLIPDVAEITIDSEPIQPGDFISVYYHKYTGDTTILKNCGGMGRDISPAGVRFTGETIAIAVWGSQEAKNNGLAYNEEMKWKIWRAADRKEYDAVASYIPIVEGQPFTHQGKYAKDGISGLTALKVSTKK